MSLFNFPFVRKSIPGIGNPIFDQDVVAANQGLLDGLAVLASLPNPGFAILSGLAYSPVGGSPGAYGPGVFYLNGLFYLMQNGFNEGQYLIAAPQDVNPEQFQDLSVQNTYTQYYAAVTNNPAGATPIFAGNMAQYRIGNNDLKASMTALQAIAGQLKGAAFLAVGQTAGTVAAGDDNRFGYSVDQINALFALQVDVLLFGNTTPFTPVQPYDPATKLYVDNSNAKRILSGTLHVGDVAGAGILMTISFGQTLPNANYIVLWSLVSLGGSPGIDEILVPLIKNKSTTQFQVWFEETFPNTQDLDFDWIMFSK